MKLGGNLVLGLANSIWSALLALAIVPLYLRYLGIEAYGLIGFFSTVQALFQVLDFGLAPTVNRELARSNALARVSDTRTLLHSFACISWMVAVFIAILMVSFGGLIAHRWLHAHSIPTRDLTQAVILMGIAIACRWPIAIYQGALAGIQRQGVVSLLNIAMIGLSNGGAICVLAFWSPSLQAFFTWQAGAGIFYAILIRWLCWHNIGRPATLRLNFHGIERVWTFSFGMTALTISGLIFTQLDKILLSRLVSLDQLGRYTLSAVVASGLYVLITPFYNAIYPWFSARVATCNEQRVGEYYRATTRILATGLFSLAMVLAIFSRDIVRLWTGNAVLADTVSPIITLLAIGTAVHGVMYIPHALQLAYGNIFIPLTINFSLLIVMVPLITVSVLFYGIVGAALAWLILHALYMLFGTWLTHRYILRGWGRRWFFLDVGIPFFFSAAAGTICLFILKYTTFSLIARIGLGLLFAASDVVAVWMVSPALRKLVWAEGGQRWFFRNIN